MVFSEFPTGTDAGGKYQKEEENSKAEKYIQVGTVNKEIIIRQDFTAAISYHWNVLAEEGYSIFLQSYFPKVKAGREELVDFH